MCGGLRQSGLATKKNFFAASLRLYGTIHTDFVVWQRSGSSGFQNEVGSGFYFQNMVGSGSGVNIKVFIRLEFNYFAALIDQSDEQYQFITYLDFYFERKKEEMNFMR